MFNVCPSCGEYRVDKIIRSVGERTFAECPVCSYPHEFLQLPLFIVTGSSGAGKSTMVLELSTMSKEFVFMETDILWDNRYNSPETKYREYRELWLRMAKNISQSGKPVVLCGTAMPDQFETCLEKRYFSEINYIALVSDDTEINKRLKSRPSWRGSGSEEFINGMISYNNWLIESGPKNEPPIDILNTINESSQETAQKIISWVKDNRKE